MVEIVLVKLIDGEELVAEQVSINADMLRVKRPIRLQIIPPDGLTDAEVAEVIAGKREAPKPKIAFANYMPYVADLDYTFDRKHVMLVVKPIDQIIEQYKEIFGLRTSLILPTFNKPGPLDAVKGFDALKTIKGALKD